MTTTLKTLIAAGIVTLASSAAFADGHTFNVDKARMDMTLDTNGDRDISDDELINGNVNVFDLNGDGIIDAEERGKAELAIKY